jgi:hypothetical protein
MMTDVCVASTTRAAMDYGFENTIIIDAVTKTGNLTEKYYCRTSNRLYLSGLNALGGLYAKLESSEKYIN